MTGRIHMAGGVWPIGDHRAMPAGAQGITPWEFVADCLDQAAKVFEGHGVTRMQMNDPNGPALAIAYRLGAESREFVALSLWRGSKSAQAVLSAASQPSKRAGMPSGAEAVAGLFANIGMLHLMLSSMAPEGIAVHAVAAARSRAGSTAGIPARREQAERDVMDSYGKLTVEFASEQRRQDPTVKRAEIIRRLRDAWPTLTGRDTLPGSDRTLSDFLAKKGIA